jgi:hypothetical protein
VLFWPRDAPQQHAVEPPLLQQLAAFGVTLKPLLPLYCELFGVVAAQLRPLLRARAIASLAELPWRPEDSAAVVLLALLKVHSLAVACALLPCVKRLL